MMQHEKPLLHDTIIAALSPAIGRKLAGISYCCVENEASEKDITDPGFYFGGALRLRFDPEYMVWVTWDENTGWEQAFSVSALTEDAFSEGALQCFEAHSTDQWKPFVGAVLNSFDIMGWKETPEVIRLSFGFGSALVGIGYQGRYGDGDDIFARPDTARYLDGKEKALWSSENTGQSSVKVIRPGQPIMGVEFPYNLPIWRSSYRAESPDKRYIAEIDPAYEVSMGNPTFGTLELSNGLSLPKCNPSFIWSDDSIYLAVPQFTSSWLWGIGKQRLLIIDVDMNRGWQSPRISHYIQPETFRGGELRLTLNPFHKAKTMVYRVPEDLGTFTAMTLPRRTLPETR